MTMTKNDLDGIVVAISKLSYADLRTLAVSLTDVLTDGWKPSDGADLLVPKLFDWASSWEPGAP